MIERLRTVLAGSGRELVHECRQCGTTVEADDNRCPVCRSDEIATYRLT